MRRRTAGRGDLDIGLDEQDRPGGAPRTRRRAAPIRPPIDPDADGPRRPRRSSRGKTKKKKRGVISRIIRTSLLLLLMVVVAAGAVTAYYASKLPSITSWAVPDRPPNIKIVALDGTMIANRGDTGGENVTLEELPPYVGQAIVAIEDRRFYSHFGVDPIRLGRVVLDAVQSEDRAAGASSITQQLARTLFLTMDRTAERKIQEAILAVWLEINYSKDDILEMYLNRVYFGGGAIGIDAAARRYFNKPASQLTLSEAAVLAGLLPRPSSYAPTVNMDAARNRQLLVLTAMVREGYVTQEEADAAEALPITTVAPAASGSGSYIADWVADLVPTFIGTIPGDIVVQTTIDMQLQAEAAQAVEAGLAENGETLHVSQAAMVSMSPDGAVRALVGGRDYNASQYNRAVDARRQPGSSFKPFVYLTALERGLMPETVRIDQPVNINGWSPENYSREYLGPVSLQRALSLSLNTVAAQLAVEVGPANVAATARRLGVTSPLDPVPSIGLGTSDVTLIEMTGAYATFANGGMGVLPYVISNIRTVEGDTLYERNGSGAGQVVRIEQVGMMNTMLRETLQSGTGRGALIDGWEAAGKTGTTQEWRDAWFVGYTSHLVTGVWVGNDDNTPMERITGGNLPAAIFGDYMADAHEGQVPASLPGSYQFNNPDGFMTAPQPNIADIINNGGVTQPYGAGATATVPPPPPGYVGPIDQYQPPAGQTPDPQAQYPQQGQPYPAQPYPQQAYPQGQYPAGTYPQGQYPAGTVPPGQVIGGQGVVPPAPVGQALPPGPTTVPPGQVVQPEQPRRGFFQRLFGG
ncbi:MAG: PBP1A family penicillin-binding protein [Bauldia sp.]